MHGRILFAAFAFLLAGCSGGSLLKPDCHSCTTEEQAWSDFSWRDLSGQWKGTVETVKSEKGAKKERVNRPVEFRVLGAEEFLKARNAACEKLPADALVMNAQLWEGGVKNARAEYEAFVPVDDDKVAYGRLSFEKMNGQEFCQFRRLGRVMGVNRLALPTVSFSEYSTVSGRSLASVAGSSEADMSLEFLRFVPGQAVPAAKGRGPAAVANEEKPPLMIRVFKVSSRNATSRGEYSGSEERLYRLWKTQ